MTIRMTGPYKNHVAGDRATFDAATSREVVASGLGYVDEVTQDHEEAIKDLHKTLPGGPVASIDGVAVRPPVSEPNTAVGEAIQPGFTPAAGGALVADQVAGGRAFERASATPMPASTRGMDARGVSPAADLVARGNPYAAARAIQDGEGVGSSSGEKPPQENDSKDRPLATLAEKEKQ